MLAPMNIDVDWIGYLGSACVLAAFCMRQMLRLRMAAIAGNVIFIGYALAAGVIPVLCMNLLLLPLNALRLRQAWQARRQVDPSDVTAMPVAGAAHTGRRAVIQVRGAQQAVINGVLPT